MQAYPRTAGQPCKTLLRGGVLLLGMALTTLAWAGDPQVKVYGKTYGEWSAQWWQWVHAIPVSTNPLLDATGEHCGEGQFAVDNDQVWFLAGTTGGEADRHCTVPHGTALLYPLVNHFFLNGPNEHVTVEAKRSGLAGVLDLACGLQSTLDGVATGIAQPTVRTQSPPFPLAIGPDNVYGLPPGVVDPEVVADGYWVLLPPLAVGTHELQVQGAVCDPDTHLPFFAVQVTYHLTIVVDDLPMALTGRSPVMAAETASTSEGARGRSFSMSRISRDCLSTTCPTNGPHLTGIALPGVALDGLELQGTAVTLNPQAAR